MVPDDDLFPADEGAPVEEGAPATPEASDTGLTREDVAGYTQRLEELGRQNAELQGSQATIAQALQNVNQVLSHLGLDGDSNGEGMDAASFLTDPEASVRELASRVADERLREQAGPLLGQLVEQTHQSIMKSEKASIAAEFGEDAWDKVFAPTLDPIIQRTRATAPSALGNSDAIRRAVNSVKGDQFAALLEMRKTAQESAASQAEETQRATLELVKSNLTHPIGRTTSVQRLTPEMKAHLDAEERDTGVRPTDSEFLRAVNTGPTLSDYMSAKQKKGA